MNGQPQSSIDPRDLHLRLYVVAGQANSAAALDNLQRLLGEQWSEVEVEVLDVFEHAETALQDRVLVTPTLIRLRPAPVRRVIGCLADTTALTQALGLGTGVRR